MAGEIGHRLRGNERRAGKQQFAGFMRTNDDQCDGLPLVLARMVSGSAGRQFYPAACAGFLRLPPSVQIGTAPSMGLRVKDWVTPFGRVIVAPASVIAVAFAPRSTTPSPEQCTPALGAMG